MHNTQKQKFELAQIGITVEVCLIFEVHFNKIIDIKGTNNLLLKHEDMEKLITEQFCHMLMEQNHCYC